MKKNFITPTINISLFMSENLITTSGEGQKAIDRAKSSFGNDVTVFDATPAQ